MGIFIPNKNGDAMGEYSYQRMGRQQRREYAIKKQAEEERRDSKDQKRSDFAAKKMEEKRREMRKACGLE